MPYLLPKIKEDGLVDFLLNQNAKTTYVEDVLVQKYPKSEVVDDIICMLDRHVSYDVVGFVDYEKGIIVLYRDYIFSREVRKQPQFVNLYDLRANLVSDIRKRIEKEKNDKLESLKLSPEYVDLYNYYKAKFLEKIIFDMVVNEDFTAPISSYAKIKTEMFVNRLKDEEVLDMSLGKTSKIDEEIGAIMGAKDFIFSDIFVPILLAEAQSAIDAGTLPERLLIIKNYVDKTKEFETEKLTVEIADGSKFRCNNKVFGNGKVVTSGKVDYEIDIEEIEKVTYKRKVLYQKGVF